MPTDRFQRPTPDAFQPGGLLGRRIQASRTNRLHHQEEDHLLWPFQEGCPVGYMLPDRPHPEIRSDWGGEFMGTWLDAACLAAWNANDEVLRAKIERMVTDWMATQGEDGYLGTYSLEERWQSWDLWIHAHSLVGLLSYYHYSGDAKALETALKAADCVLENFGPGKRSVTATGPHGGMASSAILEPVVMLYFETGEQRYLDFARWLVDVDWETDHGPKIVSSLLAGNGVAGTANAKGIEMLMDFFGLVELYRATGEARCLEAVLTAWEDIVRHHLYITGSASTGEHFRSDYLLQNDGALMIGETCVSMGWMYLNFSLGRLLGESRFFDMAEQTLYNHLLGAQSPDGRGWAYYTGLRDSKRYRWHTDPECCPSKGVRALAHLPQHAVTLSEDGVAVNLYEPGTARLTLRSGGQVCLTIEGDYPFSETVKVTIDPEDPAPFSLHLRRPGWCRAWRLSLNGVPQEIEPDERGYLTLARTWTPGDEVELVFEMPVRVLVDAIGNPGRAAVGRGPLVYAADQACLPGGALLDDVVLALDPADPAAGIQVVPEAGTVHLAANRVVSQPGLGEGLWVEPERYRALAAGDGGMAIEALILVPFFEAGNQDEGSFKDGIHPNYERVSRITYQVWLPYRLAGLREKNYPKF
jgi:hypothetical protein